MLYPDENILVWWYLHLGRFTCWRPVIVTSGMRINIHSSIRILRSLYSVKAAWGDLEVIFSLTRKGFWSPERRGDLLLMLSTEPWVEAMSPMCWFCIAWGVSWLDQASEPVVFRVQTQPGQSQLTYCPWVIFCPLLGTKQCAGFSVPSLVLETGWFCYLEWPGMNSHPQHILAIKQHFLETKCINLDCVLATTTHHKDECLTGDLCLVSYEGMYFGGAETSVLLWNWQDKLACSSLACCYGMSLHYFCCCCLSHSTVSV